jgi:hypothetical protein
MIPSDEDKLRLLLANRQADPKRIHAFINESLMLSKAHLNLIQSTMTNKAKMEAQIDHCHVELFLCAFRRLNGF